MSKPVIGIVAKYRDGDDKLEIVDSRIRNQIKQAVFDNGAVAIGIVSPNAKMQPCEDDWMKYDSQLDKDNIIEQIDLCDGIILQGGNACEAFEPFIAKYCYESDVPCLGICAGQNGVVRALGGTTYKIPNPEKHNQPDKKYVHSIHIDPTSRFYDIVKSKEIMVNSLHERTVGECPLLDKVAFCDDGYADVVESKDKTFYMGVRFHPERLYKEDENMNNIFKALIAACEK